MIYFDLTFISKIPLISPFLISAFFIIIFYFLNQKLKIDLNIFKENFQRLPNIHIYLISLLFLIFSSLKILYNWGQDYGEYYVITYLLEERGLYADGIVNINDDPFNWIYTTTNKGPTYFFFIKLISSVIGWGKVQAIFCYIFTTLLLFISFCFLINIFKINNTLKKLLILSIPCLMIYQNTNASIAFFLLALNLFSIGLFLKKNYFYAFFATLTFFTRIDYLIYIINFIYSVHFKKNLKAILKNVFYLLSISFVVYFFYSFYFQFDFKEFFNSNFKFNLNRKIEKHNQIMDILYRPKSTFILLNNYLFILFIYCFIIYSRESKLNFLKLGFDKLGIVLSSFISFIFFASTDKDYHLFVLYNGIILFILSTNINLSRYFFLISVLFITASYIFIAYDTLTNIIANFANIFSNSIDQSLKVPWWFYFEKKI